MPKPNVTRVQSASQWTASVPTLHMPKPNVTRVQSATEWGLKGFKEASRGLHLRKASRGLEGGFKAASRGLEGGLKPSEGEGDF